MVLKDFWEGVPDQAEMSAVDLVLYYSEEGERRGRKLQEVLNNDLPDMRLEIYTDFEELVTGLQRPEVDPAVVVLVIGSRTELDEFLPLRPILQKTRVVLVLPDQARETLALAERLDPYYIKAPGDDFVELASIVDEILEERRVTPLSEELPPPSHNI
jgi:hypothetical protein